MYETRKLCRDNSHNSNGNNNYKSVLLLSLLSLLLLLLLLVAQSLIYRADGSHLLNLYLDV